MHLPLHVAFWAAALTGWFGLLRKSNLVGSHAVSRDSVRVLTDAVRVTARTSKTAQLGDRPHTVFLPRLRSGGDRARLLCPWTAMLAHLGRNKPATRLFCYRSAKGLQPLSESLFSRMLRDCLVRAGLPAAGFASHSLRRGGATFANDRGVPLDDVMRLGGWSSDAVKRYVGDHAAEANRMTARRVASLVV
jgi:hypothetical protein